MKLIGLTGYIGSGKSTVAKIFAFLGAIVYDSDSEAKRLMHENNELIHEIKACFGSDIYDETGRLKSDRLRELIFGNEANRISLNNIVHPYVYRDFELFKQKNNSAHTILFESAILLKGKNYNQFDYIIFVTAKKSVIYSRVQQRSGLSRDIINKILESQKVNSGDFKLKNIIRIKNDYSNLIIPNVVKIFKTIHMM